MAAEDEGNPNIPPSGKIPVYIRPEEVYNRLPQPAGPAVVGTGEVDEISLSQCSYKNANNRKSLSVYHLQRRLSELGYKNADVDPKGYYGDLTMVAVAQFQADRGMDGAGTLNAESFAAIFEGDPNVKIIGG
jgi:peptidoglycan hydrolase-like protein with peptidoglycan-binding domain